MKKIAILTLVLMLVLALSACGNTKPTQLGTSDFSIVLPDGYASTEDDFDEDQPCPSGGGGWARGSHLEAAYGEQALGLGPRFLTDNPGD